MEFKVGQVWQDVGGMLHTIKEVFDDSLSHYVVVAEGNDGVKRTYTRAGRYIGEDSPCDLDLIDLVQDAGESEQAEQEQSDGTTWPQEESRGQMLDEGGERALFDVLAVQAVVTGLIERKGVEGTLAGIRAIIEARRAL